MARRITEDSGRHITVRQLESTVRLAQGTELVLCRPSQLIERRFQRMPN